MRFWRLAILGTAGIALMPSDPSQQARFHEQAAAAARWTMTYCDRNGEHCAKANAAWETFQAKAQFAGRALVELYQQHVREPAGTTPPAVAPPPAGIALRGTLSSQDLSLPWRGGR
jgi:hypothetical protein